MAKKKRQGRTPERIPMERLFHADNVMRELARIAFVDPARAFAKDGTLLTVERMPEDLRRSISTIDVRPDGSVRVKFWDKLHALQMGGRQIGMFAEKIEHAHSGNVAISIENPYPPKPV